MPVAATKQEEQHQQVEAEKCISSPTEMEWKNDLRSISIYYHAYAPPKPKISSSILASKVKCSGKLSGATTLTIPGPADKRGFDFTSLPSPSEAGNISFVGMER
eukprot:7139844-Ditylum_brightwellii.AAC.1